MISMNLSQLMRFSNIQYHLTDKYGVKLSQLDTNLGDLVFLNTLKAAQDETIDVNEAALGIVTVIEEYQNRGKA